MVPCLLRNKNSFIAAVLDQNDAHQGLVVPYQGELWEVVRVAASAPEWWSEGQRA